MAPTLHIDRVCLRIGNRIHRIGPQRIRKVERDVRGPGVDLDMQSRRRLQTIRPDPIVEVQLVFVHPETQVERDTGIWVSEISATHGCYLT